MNKTMDTIIANTCFDSNSLVVEVVGLLLGSRSVVEVVGVVCPPSSRVIVLLLLLLVVEVLGTVVVVGGVVGGGAGGVVSMGKLSAPFNRNDNV